MRRGRAIVEIAVLELVLEHIPMVARRLFIALVCVALAGQIGRFATSQELTPIAAKDNSQCCESACEECCPSPFCCNMCPDVYGEVEWLFLNRTAGHPNRTILIDGNTQQTLVSSSDLDFGFNSGVRALFGVRLCGCRAVEFGYFGLFNSDASIDYVGPNPNVDVTLPGPLGQASNVFHDGVRVHVDYVSRLHGAEVNFPCCCCWQCEDECGGSGQPQDGPRAGSTEWFAGFRYLSLREDLRISGEKPVLGAVETGYYDTASRNDLFGAQLGGRIRRCYGQFSWEATAKAGIFGNQAGQEQVFIDYPDFPLRPNTSSNGCSVALVGELNLTAIYQLNETWGLRLGYNLIWIEGVALAPDQLDFSFTPTSGTGLNRNDGFFMHGVNVGVEGRW
jgi:hypothetical protein